MNINASIIDQRLEGIIENHADLFPENREKSAAFTMLCISSVLNLTYDEAMEFYTDGANDAGIDGLHIGAVRDGEFEVTIFQCKYKQNLDGTNNFPENAVEKSIHTINTLFDPLINISANDALTPKLEEIRSLIKDGYIPIVKMVLCNNGLIWNANAQAKIDQAGFSPMQVSWTHLNHDSIINILQKSKSVNVSIGLSGKAVEESFNFKRVLMGKVRVTEIAKLLDSHGDNLLDKNIRRYLGINGNRVNEAIHQTLKDSRKRNDFYFLNNGITIICQKFAYNALQTGDYIVKIDGMQIINGGQTSKIIQKTLNELEGLNEDFSNCYVMVRIYELFEQNNDLINDITFAANSQNPVNLCDLHSNDDCQWRLEVGIMGLGYEYKRHRNNENHGEKVLPSSLVAESSLAIWRKAPHQAKFWKRDHFGKLYDMIFNGLNPAEAVLAAIIFRKVETLRKKTGILAGPNFLPYASYYLSMIIGLLMLEHVGKPLDSQSFNEYNKTFEKYFDFFYEQAKKCIASSLRKLYGKEKISLQQLSATFRRGDLLNDVSVWIKHNKLTIQKLIVLTS